MTSIFICKKRCWFLVVKNIFFVWKRMLGFDVIKINFEEEFSVFFVVNRMLKQGEFKEKYEIIVEITIINENSKKLSIF